MSAYQVAVVGAGPVGLTVACLLADAGIRVAVIEQADGPSDLPRAISIVDETLRTMAHIGVAERLMAETNLDTGSRYFGVGDRLLLASKPAPTVTGFPGKSQFDQPVMEQELHEAARSRSGIDLVTGTRVVELTQSASGVELVVEDAGGRRTIDSEWVIGADGGRSFVREALGIPLHGSTQTERWIVVDLLNESRAYGKAAEFHANGTRPHVIVPGIHGRLRIEFMLHDHEDPERMTSPASIRALVEPFRDHLDDHDVRRAAVYVAHRRIAARYRAGRGFLVGDAAHLMPPFAGQGLNAGIRDASNLSWKLAEVVLGRGSDQLLDTYEIERRANALRWCRSPGGSVGS